MFKFKAIAEKPSHNFVSKQYRIVFACNEDFVLARIRYETAGPFGEGWNVRCDECDEDLERFIRARFIRDGRNQDIYFILNSFRDAYEEFEREAV